MHWSPHPRAPRWLIPLEAGHEPVLTWPISATPDNYCYDHLAEVREAEDELANDLRRATDEEDRCDALKEYRAEIVDANKDYKREMRERDYPVERVTVGEQPSRRLFVADALALTAACTRRMTGTFRTRRGRR